MVLYLWLQNCFIRKYQLSNSISQINQFHNLTMFSESIFVFHMFLGEKLTWVFEYIHWNENYKTLCIHNCGQRGKLWEDKGRSKNTKSPEIFEIFRENSFIFLMKISFYIGGNPPCYDLVYFGHFNKTLSAIYPHRQQKVFHRQQKVFHRQQKVFRK